MKTVILKPTLTRMRFVWHIYRDNESKSIGLELSDDAYGIFLSN